jgi:nucleoside phosphorylase
MEAYSIAKACMLSGIECEIWKYISDKADENANTTWQEQVAAGEDLYVKVLQDLQATLEEK